MYCSHITEEETKAQHGTGPAPEQEPGSVGAHKSPAGCGQEIKQIMGLLMGAAGSLVFSMVKVE